MYLPRTIEKRVRAVAEQFPVLMLTGARRTGKTTLLRHMAGEDRGYVNLDDQLTLSEAREDPAGLLGASPGPVLIDEFQYAPQLLPYIKMAADKDKIPGRFWLTGSQRFSAMKNVSESLAGRVGIISLLGLSRREILGQGRESPLFLPDPELLTQPYGEPLTSLELFRLIWRGSLPALAADAGIDRGEYLSSLIESYVKRDVRDLAQVGDEAAFVVFLRLCAARTGQLLNLDSLSSDAGIPRKVGRQWLSVLEATGVVFLLQPYFTNLTKRLVKAPKLYFLDTGLAAYLTRWPSPETLEASLVSGAFFETWVVGELLKNWLGSVPDAPFYFYRDKDKTEIDLLIVQGDMAHPLEIKKTATPGIHDTRHFKALEKIGLRAGTGGLVCLAPAARRLTEKDWIIPAGMI